ncbi:hypothetical protein DDB_G0292126 [Dictyostelium discoideum AX4]|uniref:E3 ubiquitin-protein ligase n=1 Tax=Dictyostelium discoideum TaxID=44689 RepID=Q54DM5_DICDI|nr:hypothetical protein DDB_G0292126 [Dictyostelium discoideum AX4]EAL61419.1 hypothetical protein DDB_G0292126 [Dictyostelium discoideum AX4]|eukprot:XP_629847.1 hypothetical protein DDB_G0292126 [Dictyostelium discoideum AX4]
MLTIYIYINLIIIRFVHVFQPAFQNLIKKTVEQSSLEIEKRLIDLKSLLNIIFDSKSKESHSPSFIKLDMFGLFIRYFFINESLKNNKKQQQQQPPLLYLISLFFIGTFIQSILFVYKFKNINSILEFLNSKNSFDEIDEQVKSICSTYLRKVCFLLCCIDQSLDVSCQTGNIGKMDFKRLLTFLKESSGLNVSFETILFNNQVLNDMISKVWLPFANVTKENNNGEEPTILLDEQSCLPLRSWKELSIIPLPNDYHKYFLECTSKKKCSKCDGKNGIVKFVCLLCGELLCLKDYFIHSNSNQSLNTDIHPIGVYLLLNETYIIINIEGKSKLWGTVYLDAEHGAEDYGLKRGKPLTLNNERLGKLKSDIITLLNVHSLQTVFIKNFE